MRRPHLLAFAAVAIVAACSNLDGLSGGTDAGSATPELDGSAPETSTPTPTPPPTPNPQGDAGTFCQQVAADGGAPLFCRDFDDGDNVSFGWDGFNVDDGGVVALDPDNVSPPSSMRSRYDGGTGCNYARVIKTLPITQNVVRYALDVKLGGTDTNPASGFYYAVLVLSPGGSGCRLLINASQNSGAIYEQTGGTGTSLPLNRHPVPGTWSHVELVVNRSSRTFDFFVDGKSAFAAQKTFDAACTIGSTFDVQAGVYCVGGNEPFEVRIDDMLVTESP